jgi:uncharacterized membrane protein
MEALFTLLIIVPILILAWLIVLTVLHFTQKNAYRERLTILEVEVRSLKRLFDSYLKTGTVKPAAPEEKIREPEAELVKAKTVVRPEPPPIPAGERPVAKEVRVPPSAGQPIPPYKIPPMPPRPQVPPAPKAPLAPPQPGMLAQKWQAFKANVDWELFTGTKLFAWLGGIALFIGIGFFVKYSIDRNLIPPALRLAISALVGLALIISSFRFGRSRYEVLRHTLTACGIGVLYSVVFSATLYYHFLEKPAGFGLLTVVSAAAFVLALYHRGIVISVLGALGAYITPVLVNTGHGNLAMLFFYLAIVNAGYYYVVQKLRVAGLLLVAVLGTNLVLALGSFAGQIQTGHLTIAAVWISQLALFTAFMAWMKEKPEENGLLSWSGHVLYLSILGVALKLMDQPGSSPLLLVTAGMAGAVALALKNPGWFKRVILYGALAFVVAFLWAMVHFDPRNLSWSYAVILVYGAVGGLGPILLVTKYGLDQINLRWFQTFPVALGLMILAIVLKNPEMSFWFWPLILVLELMAILISLVFRALIQAGLLTLFFVISGLAWIFRIPADFIGPEFYGFLLLAGALLSMAIFYALLKGPAWIENLKGPLAFKTMGEVRKKFGNWVTAFPGMGAFILLAVTFWVQRPFQPHLGMSTMVCFLGLSLFLARRLSSPSLGVVTVLSSLLVQGVWVLRPVVELDQGLFFSALIWSGALFCAALIMPFLLFDRFEKWSRVWMAWALFEVLQGLFLIWAADHVWARAISGWTPLLLAFAKLPIIWILMPQLRGRAERNGILAFHGGALLFYVSAIPVLLLDQGWIGLTLAIEATLLLWLNRRVAHEGLRWVASLMAPAGLLILFFALPAMKSPDSITVLNNAVLSVAAAAAALALAVKQAGFPERKLGKTDLPDYFLWLAIGTGFFLVNLIVADLFAESAGTFKVFPQDNPAHMISYSLVWLAFGAALWSVRRIHMAMRTAGLALLCLGATAIILLPFYFPDFVPGMRPLWNLGLPAYLIALVVLLALFLREKTVAAGRGVKNLLLTILLVIGFMALKVEMNTVFQPGADFRLFFGHNASMAVASAFGWLAYGLGLLLWPKGLDRGFRIAGLILILLGLIKTVFFPFTHGVAFGNMTPLLNIPTLLFVFVLLMLIGLTLNRPPQHWPFESIASRPFWGVLLAAITFYTLNMEIACVFAPRGQAFTFWTHGSLAHQLAYSLGWMVYSIGLLIVGIRWQEIRVRWAALILLLVTVFKLSFMDIWRLGGLYRVASFVGFAVVGILVSFLYQRFLVSKCFIDPEKHGIEKT